MAHPFEDLLATLTPPAEEASPVERVLAATAAPKKLTKRTLSTPVPNVPMESAPKSQKEEDGWKTQLRDLITKQMTNAQDLEGKAQGIEQEPDEFDLRPLAAVSDIWTGGKASESPYIAQQITPKDKLALATALRDKASQALDRASDTQAKLVTNANTTDAQMFKAIAMANAMGARQMASQDNRDDKNLDGWTKDFKKDLDTYDQARTVAGKIANTKTSFQRARALVDSVKDKNLTGTQMQELGESLANALGSSGVTSEQRVMALVPRTAQGSFQDMASWLLNEPRGRNQQAFVNMFMDTINREEQLTNSQLKDIRTKRIPAHRSLWEQNPERILTLANAYGISPDEVRQAFAPPSATNAPKPEVGDSFAPPPSAGEKKIVRKQYSKDGKKMRVFYEGQKEPEIVDVKE
jgi:hypothetical protein